MATVNLPIITSTVAADTSPTPNSAVLRDAGGGIAANVIQGTDVATSGTFSGNVQSLTASATLGEATDYRCDCTSGAITLTMPLASLYVGVAYNVVKVDSSGNAVTISGASGIATISSQWGRLRIVSDGTTWISTN